MFEDFKLTFALFLTFYRHLLPPSGRVFNFLLVTVL